MLDQLCGRQAGAERRFLAAGLVDDAISMHLSCQAWREALRVASSAHHERAASLRSEYMEHLLQSGQLGAAGELKEEEGNIQVR